jgi:hypothetical protein
VPDGGRAVGFGGQLNHLTDRQSGKAASPTPSIGSYAGSMLWFIRNRLYGS